MVSRLSVMVEIRRKCFLPEMILQYPSLAVFQVLAYPASHWEHVNEWAPPGQVAGLFSIE